jgi:hypothetical protein
MNKLIIKLGDRKIDLAAAGPLKWKDIKALRRLGVEDEKLTRGDPEQIDQFVSFLLERVTGEKPKQEDIDELELTELMAIVKHFSQAVDEVPELDHPT